MLVMLALTTDGHSFNLPVSVKHLHLHVVLPPLVHVDAFRYPRFHSYTKVLGDLEKHGRVISYHEAPDQQQGDEYYRRQGIASTVASNTTHAMTKCERGLYKRIAAAAALLARLRVVRVVVALCPRARWWMLGVRGATVAD